VSLPAHTGIVAHDAGFASSACLTLLRDRC